MLLLRRFIRFILSLSLALSLPIILACMQESLSTLKAKNLTKEATSIPTKKERKNESFEVCGIIRRHLLTEMKFYRIY